MLLAFVAAAACAVEIGVQRPEGLSEANRLLLTDPGVFVVSVNTKPHREDPQASATLAVDEEKLRRVTEDGLSEAGVPLASGEVPTVAARPLILHVKAWNNGSRTLYELSLWPAALPRDPRDVVYDWVWPDSYGDTEPVHVDAMLTTCTALLAQAFARLYHWAQTPARESRPWQN